MEDTLHRLWLESDPVVDRKRVKGKAYCTECKVREQSKRYCPERDTKEGPLGLEEALFQSLLE